MARGNKEEGRMVGMRGRPLPSVIITLLPKLASHSTMALAHVDVLFFDVFGTVVDWHGTVTRELRDLSRAAPSSDPSIDLSQHDWAHFATLWRQGYMRGTKELAQSGNKEKVTVDQMHLRILNELVEQVPGLADAWQHDTRERINQVWHRLDPWADTVDGLQKLKREFKM